MVYEYQTEASLLEPAHPTTSWLAHKFVKFGLPPKPTGKAPVQISFDGEEKSAFTVTVPAELTSKKYVVRGSEISLVMLHPKEVIELQPTPSKSS